MVMGNVEQGTGVRVNLVLFYVSVPHMITMELSYPGLGIVVLKRKGRNFTISESSELNTSFILL